MASVPLQDKWRVVRIGSFVMARTGVLLTSSSDIHGANFGQRTYLAGNLLIMVACAASAFYNTYCKFLVERENKPNWKSSFAHPWLDVSPAFPCSFGWNRCA